ncbi:MAG: helix-turn-helix transcriptional regulator, partial [Atopobiaceae bacterium]|nr:helix-turn-helix transcriptional regulator [Atopobiaceae bacterium]
MDIHANIRALRHRANLSQGELAAAVGVSRGTIGAWEAGTATPRLGSVERLATVFGCRPSELVGYEPVHLGSICV